MTHLKNMGFYDEGDDQEVTLIRFQAAHPGLEITGTLDQKTKDAIKEIVEGGSMQEKL